MALRLRSPLEGLSRATRRMADSLLGRAAINAGGAGKRWPTSGMRAPSQEVTLARGRAGARARWFVANSPEGAAIPNAVASNMIGDGPSIRPNGFDKPMRDLLTARFGVFWDRCDTEGLHDLAGFLWQVAWLLVVDGEVFVHLGADPVMGRRFGQIAAATEADILVKLLTQSNGLGPKMSDGKTVFHADHANLAAVGVTPWEGDVDGVSTLGAIRTAMRRQKGMQGQPIAVTPKFLVVPPEGETWGEKVLSDIAAATVSDANPFSSKLQLVVEPRLTNTKAWYVVADPNEATSLEWAYLEGQEGPQIESRAGWEVEGVEFKLKITFGAGFVDHRGWYRNPGSN